MIICSTQYVNPNKEGFFISIDVHYATVWFQEQSIYTEFSQWQSPWQSNSSYTRRIYSLIWLSSLGLATMATVFTLEWNQQKDQPYFFLQILNFMLRFFRGLNWFSPWLVWKGTRMMKCKNPVAVCLSKLWRHEMILLLQFRVACGLSSSLWPRL